MNTQHSSVVVRSTFIATKQLARKYSLVNGYYWVGYYNVRTIWFHLLYIGPNKYIPAWPPGASHKSDDSPAGVRLSGVFYCTVLSMKNGSINYKEIRTLHNINFLTIDRDIFG